MKDFCEIYDLQNVVIGPTCSIHPLNPSSIDLVLTNKCKRFQNEVYHIRSPRYDSLYNGIVYHHVMTVCIMESFIATL